MSDQFWWQKDLSKKRIRAASYQIGDTKIFVAGRPDYDSHCDSEFDLDEIDGWMNITDRFVPQPDWTHQAWFPWRECGPPSPEVIHGSLRTLHYWIDQLKLKTVFVHCDAGTHRSVTVFGAYLLTYHPEQAEAIAKSHKLYGKEEAHHSCPLEYWRSYIRDYPELETLAQATKNPEDSEWGCESLDSLGDRLKLSWCQSLKREREWAEMDKEVGPKDAHKVLWVDTCLVCNQGIAAFESGPGGYNMPGASLCDYANPDGCFKNYHDGCFDKHVCPAHPAVAVQTESQSGVRDEDLQDVRELLEFWGNNCGGCETCSQHFGNKTQPDFSLQELHAIVCELQERRKIK